MTSTTRVSPDSRRLRRTVRWLVAVAALVVAFSACTPQQNQAFNHINSSRRAHGVPGVGQNLALTMKAQRWAEHLAAVGRLAHSNLASGVPYRYRLLGENVGYGSSIAGVHSNFMRSSGHRANILNRRFNYAGTGVAYGRGHVWVVQVFMQY